MANFIVRVGDDDPIAVEADDLEHAISLTQALDCREPTRALVVGEDSECVAFNIGGLHSGAQHGMQTHGRSYSDRSA